MSAPEFIQPHVLFNDINHGKASCFLDFRDMSEFSLCRIRSSVNIPCSNNDDIGDILNDRLGNCKSKSIQLYWLVDTPDVPDTILIKFNEVSIALDSNDKDNVWSKIKSSVLVDYDEFYSIYGTCESIFEGEVVRDDNLSTFTNEYPSEILPKFMFLGSFFSATDPVVLRSLRITHIIDATGELSSQECAKQNKIVYLPILIWDNPSVDIAAHFDTTNAFIDECRAQKGGKILIHCRAGISRSTTFVLAYLLHSRLAVDLKEALSVVLDQRPYICPNVGFRHQLRQYELSQLGSESFDSDGEFSDCMKSKNTMWVGNFSFYDRMPIAAAKSFGGDGPFLDELPKEGECKEVKPKKAFLKRGQGKTAVARSKNAGFADLTSSNKEDDTAAVVD